MMAVPLAVVWLCSEILFFELPTAAVLFVSLASGFVCSAVAARIWERRTRTTEISFSELMIWSWYRLQKAERRLEKALSDAQTADTRQQRIQVLSELNSALESKDPYTHGHSKRVERYSFMTGVAMELSLEDVEVLRMSASVHDVGKVSIPNSILHKPGRLSDEERAVIEEHPVLGAERVVSIGDKRIVETVRHHHERWDGGGYPDGIAGTDIPLFSRVIAVADSYDAIRSNRSYRTGASRDKAVDIIRAESGHQFDPEVVDAFMTTLPARSRVVAAFTSLTGPGALWRYLWQLLQRFGSAGLAPALGAIGAGAIVMASPLLSLPDPAHAAVAASLDSHKNGTAASGSSEGLNEGGDTAERRGIERRRTGDQSADRDRNGTRRRTASNRSGQSTSKPETQNAGSTRGTQSNGSTGGASAAGSAPGTQDAGTSSQPASSSATTADMESIHDPNAQEGKDCLPGLGKRSKGSTLHCN